MVIYKDNRAFDNLTGSSGLNSEPNDGPEAPMLHEEDCKANGLVAPGR